MRFVLHLLLLCLVAPAAADSSDVQVSSTPSGGERVLENRYLRVTVRVPQGRDVAGYGTRFTWGGWIDQITYRPDRVDYLWNPPEGRSPGMGFGLPEEFELPVLADSDETAERWIKPGVGVLRRRKDAPGSAELIEAPAWAFETVSLPRGGRALRFAQTVGPVGGVGYHYEKEIALDPDSTAVRLRMAFQNIGTRPFRTEWFTHAFCAPAGYGPDCWLEIPYRLGSGDKAYVERESYPIPDLDLALAGSHSFWGWLTPEQIGGAWYAVGSHRTGHYLAATLSEDPIRLRLWMNRSTYSPEPFLRLDLAPGQVKHWEAAYICGRGLDALTGVGPGGALRVEADPEGLTAGAQSRISLRFVAARPLRGVIWRAEATGPGGKQVGRWHGTFGSVKPDRPAKAELHLTPPAGRLDLHVVADLPKQEGTPLAVAHATFLLGPHTPTAARRHQAHGDRALIIAAGGRQSPSPDVVYLDSYLRWAGFRPEVEGPEALAAGGLGSYRCVLIPGVGLPALTPKQGSGLQAYVEAGGGLVHTAPLVLASGPASEILPVAGPAEAVESARWRFFYGPGGFPQEGGIPDVVPERIHLRKAASHPIVDDLALYPEAPQSIARIEKVRLRDDARVLLAFTRDDAPALVLGRHGRGRVAVFAAPVAWGEPCYWVIWGRLAEYHRKLFAETALWAAGLVP